MSSDEERERARIDAIIEHNLSCIDEAEDAYSAFCEEQVRELDKVLLRVSEYGWCVICDPAKRGEMSLVSSGNLHCIYTDDRISDADVEFPSEEAPAVLEALRNRKSGDIGRRVGVEFHGDYAYFFSPRNTSGSLNVCCPVTMEAVADLIVQLEALVNRKETIDL